MPLTTKPRLIFLPSTYTAQYDGSVEPDADGWTLTGTDHASSDGDTLTIENAGTDTNYYVRALAAHSASDIVAATYRVKIDSGCTTCTGLLRSSTINGRVYFQFTDDTTVRFTGAVDVTVDATQWMTVTLVLSTAQYWAFVDGKLVAQGAPAVEGTYSRAEFGKTSTTDDDVAQYWDRVDYGEADTFDFTLPLDRWNPYTYDIEANHNEALDGSLESLFIREMRMLTFDSRAHTTADLVTLNGHAQNHIRKGEPFLLIVDSTDMTSTAYNVRHKGKKWTPRLDPQAPTRFSLAWSLRVVE